MFNSKGLLFLPCIPTHPSATPVYTAIVFRSSLHFHFNIILLDTYIRIKKSLYVCMCFYIHIESLCIYNMNGQWLRRLSNSKYSVLQSLPCHHRPHTNTDKTPAKPPKSVFKLVFTVGKYPALLFCPDPDRVNVKWGKYMDVHQSRDSQDWSPAERWHQLGYLKSLPFTQHVHIYNLGFQIEYSVFPPSGLMDFFFLTIYRLPHSKAWILACVNQLEDCCKAQCVSYVERVAQLQGRQDAGNSERTWRGQRDQALL